MSDAPAQELPRIPELEEDYELVRELGRGGTAVVYLARERDVGRYVAIKLMHSSFLQDEEATARFVREARTVARLQHPNIVMLLGVRRLGERGYALILQYVPGTTVKERIRAEGPLPIPLAERILIDLGSALQYAHRHRIVHRDIKPENVFLDEETGVSRLADFGIARPWDTDSGLTLPGTAIGTPTYMSPEQVDGRDLDGRSDLYSVGLVAYEMLTGQPPWAGETLYKIVYKQKHEELPSLAELRPEVPYYIQAAIERALRKDPNERWRDAGEFLAALQNPYAHLARPTAAGGAGGPGPSPLRPPPPDAGLEDQNTVLFRPGEVPDVGPPDSPGSSPSRVRTSRRTSRTPRATRAEKPPKEPRAPRKQATPMPPGPPPKEESAAPPREVEPAPRGPSSPGWLVALEQGQLSPSGYRVYRRRPQPTGVTWDPGNRGERRRSARSASLRRRLRWILVGLVAGTVGVAGAVVALRTGAGRPDASLPPSPAAGPVPASPFAPAFGAEPPPLVLPGSGGAGGSAVSGSEGLATLAALFPALSHREGR